jgi:hypothetical protein
MNKKMAIVERRKESALSYLGSLQPISTLQHCLGLRTSEQILLEDYLREFACLSRKGNQGGYRDILPIGLALKY